MNRVSRRIMAFVLAMILCANSLDMTAFAANLGAERTVPQSSQLKKEASTVSENEIHLSEESVEESREESRKEPRKESGEESVEKEVIFLEQEGQGIELLDGEVTAITLRTKQDFIDLSQMNPAAYQDAIISVAPHEGTVLDLSGEEFNGFGAEGVPFRGKIGFSGDYSGYIILDKALFHEISEDAQLTSTINLCANNDMKDPLFAKKVVKGSGFVPFRLSIAIDAVQTGSIEDGDFRYSSFGGIVGEIEENTIVFVSVFDAMEEGYTQIDGNGNRGLVCNTVKAGAQVQIPAISVQNELQVTAKSGNAGAIIGRMEENAVLVMETAVAIHGGVSGTSNAGGLVGSCGRTVSVTLRDSYSVNGVTISSANGNAGGMIGEASDLEFVYSPTSTIKVNASLTANANTGAAGGLFGAFLYDKEEAFLLDMSSIVVNKADLRQGFCVGGVFGKLQNGSTSAIISIKNINQTFVAEDSGKNHFGGLIGNYNALHLQAGLVLANDTVTNKILADTLNYGGLIGTVEGDSYIQTDDVTVTVNRNGKNPTCYGGIISNGGENTFLNLGNCSISGNYSSNTLSAGLVGAIQSGVIRLHGKTNLASSKTEKNTRLTGQLIGNRYNTLVYALGDGETEGDNKWCLVRSQEVLASDIADWGEVLRLDGEKLTETKNSQSASALLDFDEAAHTVTITGFSAVAGEINNTREFVADALSFQLDEAGPLKKEKNIPADLSLVLKADVNLEGTGITGFTRDNYLRAEDERFCIFNGELRSESEAQPYTITLATGEAYGLRSGLKATGEGCGQIYDHSYIGLFAKKTGSVNNVTIDGKLIYRMVNTGAFVYCGALSACMPEESALSCEKVTVDTEIYFTSNDGDTIPTTKAAGYVGYAGYGAKISLEQCGFGGAIYNSAPAKASAAYGAGFVAYLDNCTLSADGKKYETAPAEGNLIIRECELSGTIHTLTASTNAYVGGVLASTGIPENSGTAIAPGKIKITIENLKLDQLSMDENVSGSSGGFLGYEWRNTDVSLTGLKIGNSTLNTHTGSFGGLVYQASGEWQVYNNLTEKKDEYSLYGIQFDSDVSIVGRSKNDYPSALVISRGDNYVYTKNPTANNGYHYALYFSLQDAETCSIAADLDLHITGTYFDELVGCTFTADASQRDGIVSIATPENLLVNQTGLNTYHRQLATDYKNPNTRYYYNLEALRLQGGSVWADTTVESGEELLLWSVGQECEQNISPLFCTSKSNAVVIDGLIDVSGLSYYSIDFCGNVTITDATIRFDYEKMNGEEVTAANKAFSDKERQHYRMQSGLLYTLYSEENLPASLCITGETGVVLQGTIGQLAAGDHNGGSGVLVCGKMQGATDGTHIFSMRFSDTNIFLDGLRVANVDTYAPLLINEIGSYSMINLGNVSTTSKYMEADTTVTAASSLLGIAGPDRVDGAAANKNIVLSFENMKLNAYKTNQSYALYNTSSSIFSRATFLESFSYALDDTASSGTYNFNLADTVTVESGVAGGNVTYGVELSNTASGRNPGLQYHYYDDGAWVTDVITGVSTENSTDETCFAGGSYLRYVAVAEGAGGVDWSHEIDINQMVFDIVIGCGTYDDPYLITDGKQLQTLATFLATESISNWKVQMNYQIAHKRGLLTSHGTGAGMHYLYTAGNGEWTTSDAADSNLTTEEAMAYLRNAYYVIADDIELDGNFYGLGGYDPSRNVFSGVIVGNKAILTRDGENHITGYTLTGEIPTVYIPATHGSDTKTHFGGLITYSGGSVVKNLKLDYSNATLTMESEAPSQQRASQAFFGGVIGYVVGGDNIIDNVEVKYTNFKLHVNGVNEKITDVGGYVGLVGGNVTEGGGVIFRNMDGKAGLPAGMCSENYYYRNPYLGRVLDGYAFSEGCRIDNTDKNYTIPEIDLSGTDVPSVNQNGKTVTISSAQQLWILSGIVNSGAAGMSSATYTNDAYRYGKIRRGAYDNVGTNAGEQELYDEKYWGGISYDNQGNVSKGKIPYLASKCIHTNYTASSVERYITYLTGAQQTGFKLLFTADCDMTDYGNGFRGIGTTYQDNKSTNIRFRTMSLSGTIGSDSQVVNITYYRDVREYTIEGKDGWWAQGIGLFTALNLATNAAVTVKNLHLEGCSQISYSGDANYIGEASAGGFAGMTANLTGVSSQTATFNNVTVSNMTVKGAKYSGGYFGVVGKSSRTIVGSTKITQIGQLSMNYVFNNCGYRNLKIEGGYSAGGFIGTFRNDGKTLKVNGITSLSDSEIGWVRDACLEMYDLGCTADAKTNGYSGGAGIVGYYYGSNMTVNDATGSWLILDNMYIYGPQFAYNCDYGLGGIIGLQSSGTLTVKNINMRDTTIEVIVKDDYVGPHAPMPAYYTTPACGLLKGYTGTAATSTNLTIQNCNVINAGYCAGLIGQAGGDVTLTTTDIDGLTVYTQGSGSYSGSAKVGGLFGGCNNVTCTDLSMKRVTVFSDGSTGLLIGMTRPDKNQNLRITNFYSEDCTVVTSQNPTSTHYLGAKTDPGVKPTDLPGTDLAAGAAGIFFGINKDNSSGKGTGGTTYLKVYNAALNNPTIGYYCGQRKKVKFVYDKETDTGKFVNRDNMNEIVLSKANIGVYTGQDTGIPYESVTVSEENRYTGGYLGLLTGGHLDNSTGYLQVVGITVKGGNYPSELNGYDEANFPTMSLNASGAVVYSGNKKNNNYIIWGDYLGTSTTDTPNTEGTIGKIQNDYPLAAAASSPYTVISPSSGLKVYSSKTDTKGMVLTGNGMVDTAKRGIVSDLISEDTGTPFLQKYWRTYYKVPDEKRLAYLGEKFSSKGIYKDKLTNYSTASESDLSTYVGVPNFDVLLIDITKSSEITEMVLDYISVLTNYDQTNRNTVVPPRFASLTTYTYQYDKSLNRFIKTTPSLVINADKSISVKAGAHDNQRDQFTVIDAFYENPNNTAQGYHLFIPVVVKKILQTDFDIKLLNGKSAYANAYTSTNAILASYGEDFTAQLTYSYTWTASEWNDNIASGTNFLWSYDKQVKLGNVAGSLKQNTTRYTLVDMNRRGAGNTFFVGTGSALSSATTAAVLPFGALTGYESMFLSDLMELTVTEDTANGTLKFVGYAGNADAPLEGATIRIWDGDRFAYYGLKDAEQDEEDTVYYTIKVTGEDTENVTFKEVYYLTINCKEGSGVLTQDATLGLNKMVSANEKALPSKMGTTPATAQYTMGDFYVVTGTKITTESEALEGLINAPGNDYIDVNVEAKVRVPRYQDIFNDYAKDDDTYFRFAIQMHNDNLQSGSELIDASEILPRSISVGGVLLEPSEYTVTVKNGICYLLIKKKGNDFLDTTVQATLRFSYEDDLKRIAAQFPQRQGMEDVTGISFSVESVIGYSENSLDGSKMGGKGTDSARYYREEISVASLKYNSYNITSFDGNTSQLGINGKEVPGDHITSLGMYDATQVSGLEYVDKASDKYPAKLVCQLQLEKKTDLANGEAVYSYVPIGSFLKEFEVESAGKAVDSASVPTADSMTYDFVVDLTDSQVENLSTKPLEMDLSYYVLSDRELEALGHIGQYANYRVTLNAYLANKDGTRLVDNASDYIIYTNAKFYLGILSGGDFDE